MNKWLRPVMGLGALLYLASCGPGKEEKLSDEAMDGRDLLTLHAKADGLGLDHPCLFSQDPDELKTQTGLTFSTPIIATAANVSDIPVVYREQIIKAMQLNEYPAANFESAISYTDEQKIVITPFQAEDGRGYVLFDYYSGDNPMGFIFADVDQPAVTFCDGLTCQCTIAPDGACLWDGETMQAVIEHPDHQKGARVRYDQNSFDTMPPIHKEQLRRGMEALRNEFILTAEEAFHYCDYGPNHSEVSTQQITHQNGLTFVYFEFTQGENSFGFAFLDAEAQMAFYGDGDLAQCAALRLTTP